MLTSFTLPAVPYTFSWEQLPTEWDISRNGSLSISTGAETDWFIDPTTSLAKDTAPSALCEPTDPFFLLSARVDVAFHSTFDAGALHIRFRSDLGAKLCFEYSPQGQPMVVSVVTRGVSDDCNSVIIAGSAVYLRITRRQHAYAFHYSLNGTYWHLIRHFALEAPQGDPRLGFSVQSPTGSSCRAVFSEVRYVPSELHDIRDGA